MLELDECNQLLVENSFSEGDPSAASSSDHHDDVTWTSAASTSEQHPLRSQSISPACRCGTPSIPSISVLGKKWPRLNGPQSWDAQAVAEDGQISSSAGEGEPPWDDNDVIIHPVGPNDSLAGVALRYDVSIAALRRANQLWPSDPIHLRTELLIPCGNTLRTRRKCAHSASTDATVRSAIGPTPGLSPDLVPPSFVSARNLILSMLPGRLSLESLSSKASASEDHELDDFGTVYAREIPAAVALNTQEGHELSVLGAQHVRYKRPGVPLLLQVPTSPINHQHSGVHHIPPSGDLRLQSISSSPASLGHLPCTQPFTVVPVRTSQLEPEPSMELPVWRSRVSDHI